MKAKLYSKYLKADIDVREGDILTFLDEGSEEPNQWGQVQATFTVRTESGAEKKYSPNNDSLAWLIRHYGDETKEWIDKQAPVFIVTKKIGGAMKRIVNLGTLEDLTNPQTPTPPTP